MSTSMAKGRYYLKRKQGSINSLPTYMIYGVFDIIVYVFLKVFPSSIESV